MKEGETGKFRILAAFFILVLISLGVWGNSIASGSEGLYVDTSTATRTIYNEANCHGAPDDYDAYISGPLANTLDSWTFDFANTTDSSATFDSGAIYITHWATGHDNDVLVLEYFDGTNWNIFKTFNSTDSPPTARFTSGPFSADSIINWSQVYGFQVRLRGIEKVQGSDVITYYVDAVELRVFYTGNQAPALDPIGSKLVDEGSHLEFVITSSDSDGDSLILTAEDLPANSSFTDSGNGHGLFTFDPDSTQAGVYPVRFIVSDGALADTEVVDITVNQVNLY